MPRLIVWSLSAVTPGLPLASSNWIVTGPMVPATRFKAALVIATVSGVMVRSWLVSVEAGKPPPPLNCASMVYWPAAVPPGSV